MLGTELSRRAVLSALGIFGVGAAVGVAPATAEAYSFELRSLADTVAKFGGRQPNYWGVSAPGVHSRFSTTTTPGKNAVCLTFDACGGSVTHYDAALIDTLRSHQAVATLFVNEHWARNNPSIFQELLADPLFEIQNHGSRHLPLSVNGQQTYGITGTASLEEVWNEIAGANKYFAENGWTQTKFMRPGTCFTDDVSAAVAEFMGQPIVNFSVNGDAGATFTASQVHAAVSKAQAGDIVLSHMNHPGSGTAAGYASVIHELKQRGLQFRKVSEVLVAPQEAPRVYQSKPMYYF